MRAVSDIIGSLRSALQEAGAGGGGENSALADIAGRLEQVSRALSGSPHSEAVDRVKGLLLNFDALTGPQRELVAAGALSALEDLEGADWSGSGPERVLSSSSGAALGNLDQPVQYVKGVGPKRAQALSKLGINTVGDALYYFPYRYEDRSNFKKIAKVTYGTYETVAGTVVSSEVVTTRRRRFKIFELAVKDDTGTVTGVWFNQPFMQKAFKTGDRVVLSGVPKPDQYTGGRTVMENPEHEVLSGEGDDTVHTGRVVPIYRATAGISVRQIRQVMKGLVDGFADGLAEFLPADLLDRYKIPGLADAVREAHFPENEKDTAVLNDRASRAHKRLIFDEFLILQMGLALMKRGRVVNAGGVSIKGSGALSGRFIEELPFRLTAAQEKVISEIYSDMASARQMNRLVQGDVGCGKTVVALAAIIRAAESGYQSALMAPTEILAEQHYLNVKGSLGGLGLSVELITSSLKKKEKERVQAAIAEGRADLAVGTHSLIQGGVSFKSLGLCVTDEQHRFGVMQRAVLRDKGDSPDVLVMTATPIPRTLALTVYGDLDVSVIDSMPPGRSPVVTKLFDEKNRAEVYRLVKKELAKGRQAYVVYPLVEESERSDLRNAKEGALRLGRDVFPGANVGLIHGKMKPAEKETVMSDFRSGGIDVLVATTVVEVGVDVPNATVVVVEHADRFGLAQLHQLRGRVGRGAHQSYCVLVSSAYTPQSRERLGAMLRSTSGFDIAEEDLRIRGPGEFFGTRQSGLPDLVIGNILRDAKILEAARKEAFGIIDGDPELRMQIHAGLRDQLERKWRERLGMVTVG